MIFNDLCPYCSVELVVGENLPNGRSVEHLIPNTALTTPRNKGEGDFYACRTCNGAKSKIDYVLGVIAKAQSPNPKLAASALIEAVTSDKKAAAKFIDMVRAPEHRGGGVLLKMPIEGRDLFDYFMFLAKGQHFKTTGQILDLATQVALLEFASKSLLQSFEEEYGKQHGTLPMADLSANPRVERIGGDECLIWSREHDHMIVFHWYTGVLIQIRPRSRKNYRMARELEQRLLREFPPLRRRRAD